MLPEHRRYRFLLPEARRSAPAWGLIRAAAWAFSIPLAGMGLLAGSPKPDFTATMVSQTFHGNSSTASISEQITHARRADGSLATHTRRTIRVPTFSPNPEFIEWHEVLDATRQTRAIMYPALHRKSTTPLTLESAASMRRAAPAECRPAEPDVQYDSAPKNSPILGFRVVTITRTIPASDGSRVFSKVYLAPELDCFALQSESSEMDSAGTLLSRQIKMTVTLTQGPPHPDIFEIRTDYVESTPSAIYDEDSTNRGKNAGSEFARAAKARGDARYYELRKR